MTERLLAPAMHFPALIDLPRQIEARPGADQICVLVTMSGARFYVIDRWYCTGASWVGSYKTRQIIEVPTDALWSIVALETVEVLPFPTDPEAEAPPHPTLMPALRNPHHEGTGQYL